MRKGQTRINSGKTARLRPFVHSKKKPGTGKILKPMRVLGRKLR